MFGDYIAFEFCVSKCQINESQCLVKQGNTHYFWRYSLWFKYFMTHVNMFPHSTSVYGMPLLCELCGCSKMLDIFGSSWLVASEVRTVPLIQVSTYKWTFALIFFLSFATTKCIRVISYSRMFISRRLLPGVVEVLWYLAVNQLCNPSEMFCILHRNTLERSGCTLKSTFLCVWIINSVLFQTSIQINYEKKLAVGQLHFGAVLFFQTSCEWAVFWWESFSDI